MFKLHKIGLILLANALCATALLNTAPYDFFQPASVRIQEASEYLKKTVATAESDAAQVALFLEQMRSCYYEHLDRLEAAVLYWEYAKHHGLVFKASQLPHKWFN